MSFEWDSAKAKANLRKHGIDFADAVAALEDEASLTIEDASADGERRWITTGMDALGRVLVVVYTWRGDAIRLISTPAGNGSGTEAIRGRNMKREYDFSNAKRGPVVQPAAGKTRITIRLDNAVLDWFRAQAHKAGGANYQSMVNEALKQHIESAREPLATTLRRVLREELRKAG